MLIEQAPITREVGGGFRFEPVFFFFFKKRGVSSIPEACGSVTCTLGEDHTAGRQASAPLAVR